jgi:hypothetical protein
VSECEFQEHDGNCALIAAVLRPETESNNEPNEAGKEGGGPQPCFQWSKIAGLTKQYA